MAMTRMTLSATIAPPLFAGRAVPSLLFAGRTGAQRDMHGLSPGRSLHAGARPDASRAVAARLQDRLTQEPTPGSPASGHTHSQQPTHAGIGTGAGGAGSRPRTYSAQGTIQSAANMRGATVNLTA
jgi:hypothetical protein